VGHRMGMAKGEGRTPPESPESPARGLMKP
jgi:hypothetical protein